MGWKNKVNDCILYIQVWKTTTTRCYWEVKQGLFCIIWNMSWNELMGEWIPVCYFHDFFSIFQSFCTLAQTILHRFDFNDLRHAKKITANSSQGFWRKFQRFGQVHFENSFHSFGTFEFRIHSMPFDAWNHTWWQKSLGESFVWACGFTYLSPGYYASSV